MKKYLCLISIVLSLMISCSKKNEVDLKKKKQDLSLCGTIDPPAALRIDYTKSARVADITEQFVIFLDFNGAYINLPEWNNGHPFNVIASTLTTDDRNSVIAAVAEDFSPFKATVTTDSTLWAATSIGRRARCNIGIGMTPVLGYIGGVAWNGSSVAGTYESPCFVLSDNLSNSINGVALATSHEVGHTLGLYHQAEWSGSCVLQDNGYHNGYGTGAKSWGPIMGDPYGKAMTTWTWSQTNLSCNDIQNDFLVISTNLPYKADIDPNSNPANYLTPGYRNVSPMTNPLDKITGVLEQPGDFDVIKFSGTPGSNRWVELSGTGIGNIDYQIDLYFRPSNAIASYSYAASFYTGPSDLEIVTPFTIPANKAGGLFVIRANPNSPYAPNTPVENPTYSPGWKKMIGQWYLKYR